MTKAEKEYAENLIDAYMYAFQDAINMLQSGLMAMDKEAMMKNFVERHKKKQKEVKTALKQVDEHIEASK